MTAVDDIYVAVLTKDKKYAGTDSGLNFVVSADPWDVYNDSISSSDNSLLNRGAGMLVNVPIDAPANLESLRYRFNIRGADAWSPAAALVFGRMFVENAVSNRYVMMAATYNYNEQLSAAISEGKVSTRVDKAFELSTTTDGLRRRVDEILIIVETSHKKDSETDGPVNLTIYADDQALVDFDLPLDGEPSSQKHLQRKQMNFYVVQLNRNVTLRELHLNWLSDPKSGAYVKNKSDDLWRFKRIFVFAKSLNSYDGLFVLNPENDMELNAGDEIRLQEMFVISNEERSSSAHDLIHDASNLKTIDK